MSFEKKTKSACASCSAESVTGSISDQSDMSEKTETKHPAGEAKNTATVASERYESYRIAYYGTPAEKETYRQQIRSKLKDQVKEKDDLRRKQLIDRVAESDTAVTNDQKSRQEDNNQRQKKADYLKQFSNENKKIMEEKQKDSRRLREADIELERKLLNVNPINWNMTLH